MGDCKHGPDCCCAAELSRLRAENERLRAALARATAALEELASHPTVAGLKSAIRDTSRRRVDRQPLDPDCRRPRRPEGQRALAYLRALEAVKEHVEAGDVITPGWSEGMAHKLRAVEEARRG